jgi:hypothetical protein
MVGKVAMGQVFLPASTPTQQDSFVLPVEIFENNFV